MILTPDAIADALATAPAWAQIALTVPQERLREDARREVAQHVYSTLCPPTRGDMSAQLPLPL